MGWVNATVKHWPTSDVTGHIILVRKAKYPYDGFLRKISPMRPAAVLFVQETVGFPGDGMYAVDGRERKSITIPVAETYASKKVNASLIPDGTYLEMHVDYNVYTDIKGSAYFPVMNSIVSIWEWCILILAGYHLYLFSRSHLTFSWLSIGPLCLVLEMIGLAIRFGTTIVDPFYSNRLLHVNAMGILISVHMPFLISSGILLTFYCTFPFFGVADGGTQSCSSIRPFSPFLTSSLPSHFPKLLANTNLRMSFLTLPANHFSAPLPRTSSFLGGFYSSLPVPFCILLLLFHSLGFVTRFFGLFATILRGSVANGARNTPMFAISVRFHPFTAPHSLQGPKC